MYSWSEAQPSLQGPLLQGDGVFKTTGSTTVLNCGGLSSASPVYMQGARPAAQPDAQPAAPPQPPTIHAAARHIITAGVCLSLSR